MNRSIQFLLLALVVLSPLPFGSVLPWHQAILYVSLYLVGILLCLKQIYIDSEPIRITPIGWVLFGFVGLIVIQLIPLPVGILEIFSENTIKVYERVGFEPKAFYPISLYSYATYQELYKLIALSVFYIALVNQQSKSFHFLLCCSIVVIGFFEAVYGLYELWSGHLHIWGIPKWWETTSAYGTFVNRNHFAALLVISIFTALGLFLSKMYKIIERKKTLRRILSDLFAENYFPYFLSLFAAILMMLALFFSRSKGGMLSLVTCLFLFCVLIFIKHPGSFRKWSLWMLLICFLSSLVCLFYVGADSILERFKITSLMSAVESRGLLWLDSLNMFIAFPLFGVGGGAYANVFPLFEKFAIIPPRHHVNHAHNEYIEAMCEFGGIGLLLVLIGAFIIVGKIWKQRSLLSLGLLSALVAISLHNFIEFNLHIPSLALWYVLLLGLVESRSLHERSRI